MAIIRKLTGFSSHNCVKAFRGPEFTVLGVPICTNVIGTGKVAVIMAADTCLDGWLVRFSPSDGIGKGNAVKGHFICRCAEFYLPLLWHGIQKGIHKRSSGSVVTKMICIIPFAPTAHKTGLYHHDYIVIFLNKGFDLFYVTKSLLQGCIPGFIGL